ncbi:MAG TPA: DNA polymerase IV [Candidatus Acidoferrum sp.]|nr:DNA polymerase IV [Candidatus Acidoferrum sp.]
MANVQTKFIHCDCDCFYAAVEMRDDPALRGLPVAVGGDETRRGVISTCNYEARRYGVHSAMASATARRLCRDLIIIPPNFEKYREASQRIHCIYQDYTDLIEPLSLDEAFLDVTHSTALQGSGSLIARDIRRRVREEIGITLSAGIAPNKFLAKIASDWNKPDGQYVITPDQVAEFMLTLPVKKIHGVGKVTAKKMQLMGIDTCADLQTYTKPQLLELFGSFGERLYALCRGEDDRKIAVDHAPKSISVEQTYAADLQTVDQCLAALPALLDELQQRLDKREVAEAINKQFVKLKFSNFVSTTVEQVASAPELQGYLALCRTGFERSRLPVRLLGVGVRLRQNRNLVQLELPLQPQ